MFAKRLLFISLAAAVLLAGCSDDQNAEVDDRTAFETYLKGKGVEYTVVGGVYKYIVNAQRPGRENEPVISDADSVYMEYTIREFSSGGPGRIYFTNVASYIDSLAAIGLTPTYWPREEEKIKLGTTPLIKGVAKGLPGSAQGDSVELFIPADMGYGGVVVGIIPADSPVVWTIKVNKVVK